MVTAKGNEMTPSHRSRRRVARSIVAAGVLLLPVVVEAPAQAALFSPGCSENELWFALNKVTPPMGANHNGSNDTINLTAGCTYMMSATLIAAEAGRWITIRGNGATIARVGPGRVLQTAPGANLRLEDVTVVGGSSAGGVGGGIYNNQATVVLVASRVVDSTAADGGGIYNREGALILDRSEVDENAAESGGGIYNQGGTVSLTRSEVTDNWANERGSGVFNASGVVRLLSNSEISDNSTAPHAIGGGIANFGVFQAARSEIVSNSSLRGGGILNHGNVIISDGSVISDNAAAVGGGIYNVSSVAVDASSVSDNLAADGGGGVYNTGRVTFVDSTLSNNESWWGDGAGMFVDAGPNTSGTVDARFVRSTVSHNRTDRGSGGGIANFGGLVRSERSTISRNVAAKEGAGIFNRDPGTVELVDRSVVSHNGFVAEGEGGGGGVFNDGFLTIDRSIVTRNRAAGGGGILTYGKVLVKNGSRLSRNFAQTGGGAYNGFVLKITRSKVTRNRATRHGGGIYNPGTVELVDSMVSQNEAGDLGGGGIYNDATFYPDGAPELHVVHSRVSRNTSTTDGGAIYNLAGEVDIVQGSTLNHNHARSGGAIFNTRGDVTAAASTISNNTAVNDGGAIANLNDGFLLVSTSTLATNFAGNVGGAIANSDSDTTVLESRISRNRAVDGGGVFNGYLGELDIGLSTIAENLAERAGGGIASRGDATISSTTVDLNTAGWAGGGIFSAPNEGTTSPTLLVRNSTLSRNTSGEFGGGIAHGEPISRVLSGPGRLVNVTITRNVAASGGGIYAANSRLDVVNATIALNTASTVGGAAGVTFMYNSIVAINVGGNCSPGVSGVGNLSNVFGCGASFDTATAPGLGFFGSWGGPTKTIALLPTSAAVNTAVTSWCPPSDQRGFDRAGVCDKGAYELQ